MGLSRAAATAELQDGMIIRSKGVQIDVKLIVPKRSASEFKSCRNALPGRIWRTPGRLLP
jgi:hypothetical protein